MADSETVICAKCRRVVRRSMTAERPAPNGGVERVCKRLMRSSCERIAREREGER